MTACPAVPVFATIQLENFHQHMGATGGPVSELLRDCDVSSLPSQPNAPLHRLWKDHGLYDGEGAPRIAFADGKASLARTRR